MPLNTLRLNHQPSSHPNHLITFIKPLPRPPQSAHLYEHAETFLQAIAAQCLPIMKKNHLSVTTLEEHEPNREFIGRNFNNGEVIQLVLRSQDNTRWLPVNVVQMVMMHELAHNQQMNHSRKFWEVRNGFVQELRGLWSRRFTGEGFWGGGRVLGDLEGRLREGDGMVGSDEIKDLQVCSGTFRSRRTKRRRKNGEGPQGQELTWKEKRDRRIEKKYGKNGVSLGEDEDKRLSLEVQGKGPIGGKPRVAKSKRGRELRAAAALARFEINKKEPDGSGTLKKEEAEDDGTLSNSEHEYEEVDVDADQEDAKDVDGQKILDNKGNGLIRVCVDGEGDGVGIKQEMDELEGLGYWSTHHDQLMSEKSNQSVQDRTAQVKTEDRITKLETNSASASLYDIPMSTSALTKTHTKAKSRTIPPRSTTTRPDQQSNNPKPPSKSSHNPINPTQDPPPTQPQSEPKPNAEVQLSIPQTTTPTPPPSQPTTKSKACPICSLQNPPYTPTCTACSHVLNPQTDPRSWQCSRPSCRKTTPLYTNAGDVVMCGICGDRREGDNKVPVPEPT